MAKNQNLEDHLPGFDAPNEESAQDDSQSNKKKKKNSGGFQSMGLSFPILKGITKRGYKQPTPIQRKVSETKTYLQPNLKKPTAICWDYCKSHTVQTIF